MTKFIALVALFLLPAVVRAQSSTNTVVGKNQLAFVADRVASTSASEIPFAMVLSTYNITGATRGGPSSSSYTISNSRMFNATGLFMGVEAGGSVPAVSRVDFKVRTSTSAKTGDCTVTNPIAYETIMSGVATAKTVTTLATTPIFSIQGNGNITLCFTIFVPDWVTTTNVPNTTISLTGYEQ